MSDKIEELVNAINENKSFSIRQMLIRDLAEVFELGEMCFRADLWPMLYRGWDEYEVTTLFNTDGDYCFVAENDNYENGITAIDERIVGFVLGTVMSKPGTAWSYGYIIWICAHPKWQREGVASKLIDRVVEAFIGHEGTRIIMADTDPSNVKAVNFFKNKGFGQEHSHVFLTSNIENNPIYSHLLLKSRQQAVREKGLKSNRRVGISGGKYALVKKDASFVVKQKKKKKKKKKRSK